MSRSIRLFAAAGIASAALAMPAAACTDEAYVGQICIVANTFCPYYTLEAAGQTLPIAQNVALFAILGTTFGGNGVNTFALPDLRGRALVGSGTGAGLSPVLAGEAGGTENVTLTTGQMPLHTHAVQLGAKSAPVAGSGAKRAAVPAEKKGSATEDVLAHVQVNVSAAGGSQPVSVRNPALALRFCITTQGYFPPRP